jgi:hypothetical protein
MTGFKTLFVTASLLFAVCLPVMAPIYAALGYTPTNQSLKLHFGQGVWYAPPAFRVFSKPDEASPALADVIWGINNDQTLTDTINQASIPARQCMVAYYPAYQLGLIAVVGDADNGWLEIVWNQTTGQTGWVKATSEFKPGFLPQPGVYQTWTEFMTTHAKPAGIHWFNGVPDSIRQLHSQPDDYAKVVPAFYLQRLKVLHMKGNWMLMQGLDLERNSPIGWVRWREEDGRLLLFPNLDTQDNPWRKAFKANHQAKTP